MSMSIEPLSCSHVKVFFSHTNTSKSAEFRVIGSGNKNFISGSLAVKLRGNAYIFTTCFVDPCILFLKKLL